MTTAVGGRHWREERARSLLRRREAAARAGTRRRGRPSHGWAAAAQAALAALAGTSHARQQPQQEGGSPSRAAGGRARCRAGTGRAGLERRPADRDGQSRARDRGAAVAGAAGRPCPGWDRGDAVGSASACASRAGRVRHGGRRAAAGAGARDRGRAGPCRGCARKSRAAPSAAGSASDLARPGEVGPEAGSAATPAAAQADRATAGDGRMALGRQQGAGQRRDRVAEAWPGRAGRAAARGDAHRRREAGTWRGHLQTAEASAHAAAAGRGHARDRMDRQEAGSGLVHLAAARASGANRAGEAMRMKGARQYDILRRACHCSRRREEGKLTGPPRRRSWSRSYGSRGGGGGPAG